jgi:hypothetical protein
MEENDLEETRHGNGAGIWPQYRHISDQPAIRRAAAKSGEFSSISKRFTS